MTHYSQSDAPIDPAPEEWVELRPPASGRRKLLVALAVVVTGAILAAGLGAWWLQRQIDPPGAPGDAIEVVIPEGSSTGAIGEILEREGVIASAFVWRTWFVRVEDVGPFDAGTYRLRKSSSMHDVAAELAAGPLPPPALQITVPEGFTVREIVGRLADPDKGLPDVELADIQALVDSGELRSKYQPADQPSLEGLLFPDTYQVGDDEGPRGLLARMIATLDRTLDELGVASAQERFNLTPYEIVIVASLIEEESRVPEERSKVARVIYNRLSQGIPLGIDATSRYEAELAGRDRGEIDFESDSPYNTRRIAGLPPTPIAAPGRASIEAALNPADGPWIYYVLADEEGNHFFTDSASEFARAKAECEAKGLGCG